NYYISFLYNYKKINHYKLLLGRNEFENLNTILNNFKDSNLQIYGLEKTEGFPCVIGFSLEDVNLATDVINNIMNSVYTINLNDECFKNKTYIPELVRLIREDIEEKYSCDIIV